MSLAELAVRLGQIETTVSRVFEEQFRGTEEEPARFAIGPLSETDSHNIDAWLEIVRSDFLNEVLQTTVQAFTGQGFSPSNLAPSISLVARRLQAVARSLRDAGETWDQICRARQEAHLVPGGLNMEELWRYRAHMETAKDILLRHMTAAKVYLGEIGTTIEHAKVAQESSRASSIRCPLTPQNCDWPLEPKPREVFVGYQSRSDHYKTSSLKKMIREAFQQFKLSPFFYDEHFEPVHTSCELCHRLQEVSICVFEISDRNPNVMFELGLAYMLGNVTILLARRGSPGTQIADIAGIHRLQYEDLVECRDSIVPYFEDSAIIQAIIQTDLGE